MKKTALLSIISLLVLFASHQSQAQEPATDLIFVRGELENFAGSSTMKLVVQNSSLYPAIYCTAQIDQTVGKDLTASSTRRLANYEIGIVGGEEKEFELNISDFGIKDGSLFVAEGTSQIPTKITASCTPLHFYNWCVRYQDQTGPLIEKQYSAVNSMMYTLGFTGSRWQERDCKRLNSELRDIFGNRMQLKKPGLATVRIDDLTPLAGAPIEKMTIGKGFTIDPTQSSWMPYATTLQAINFSFAGFSKPLALEAIPNLQVFKADSMNPAPKTLSLKNLPALKSISLNYATTINSLSLSDLPALESLSLVGSNLPLPDLREIPFKALYLNTYKGIKNWSAFLNSLPPTLTNLELSGTGLSSIQGLAIFPNMQSLDLSANAIQDFTELSQLSNLQKLSISGQQPRDWEFLKQLPLDVRELDLSDTGLTDLALLTRFTKLEVLKLNRNSVQSLAPLAELQALSTIEAEENPIDFTSEESCPVQSAQLTLADYCFSHR